MVIFEEETFRCIFIFKDNECCKKADEINRMDAITIEKMKYEHHGGMGQWHPLEDSETHCERASVDTCEGIGRGSSFLLKHPQGVLWEPRCGTAAGSERTTESGPRRRGCSPDICRCAPESEG